VVRLLQVGELMDEHRINDPFRALAQPARHPDLA
jgi:hypothetical protein